MTLTHPRRTAVSIALLFIVAALAGCTGSEEPEGTAIPAETDVSFGSFDEARSAQGPTYPPTGLEDTDTGSDGGTASGDSYSSSYDIAVKAAASQSINVTVSLSDPSAIDDLTFELLDDGGGSVDSVDLDSDQATGTLSGEGDGQAGNWSVEVSGQALQTNYDIEWTIVYEETSPYKLKVLAPLEAISPGDAAFVFLLYDADAGEPITDASFTNFESWANSMGHGGNADQEADPVWAPERNVYVGKISPSMEAEWVVRVYVTVDGEELEFEPPIDVQE